MDSKTNSSGKRINDNHEHMPTGNHEKFRSILQSIPAAVIVHGPDTRIISTNRKARELLGLKHGRLLGRSATDPVWQFRREDGTAMPLEEYPVMQVMRTGNPVRNMVVGVQQGMDTDYSWGLVNAEPVFRPDGTIAETIVTFIDITDRKQAQQKIEQLADIVQSSDDAIIGKTLDGIIVSWNTGAEKIYGYKEAEVIGLPISILVPPGHSNEINAIDEAIKNGQHIDHYETIRRTKDGRNIHMSLTISPLRDVGGRINGASVIGRDITLQKEAEKTLRASEERFRSMFEHHMAIMLLIDPETGRIVDANPAAADFYGYSRDTLRTMNMREISMLSPEQIAKESQSGARRHRRRSFFPHRLATGEVRAVEVHASLADIGGVPLLFSIIHDITDRRRAEEAHERLNRALRLLGNCNQLLVHVDNEKDLLDSVCKLIVQTGGYLGVVVGFPAESGLLQPVTHFGFDDAVMRSLEIEWPGVLPGEDKKQRAVRRNCSTRPASCAAVAHLGCQACAAIPLVSGESHMGAMTIFADAADAFSDDEMDLLDELAGDLAYGIRTLRTRREHEAAEERLHFLAHHDALTKLPNRLLLRDRFERAAARADRDGRQLALFYLDLDNFKAVNDTLGHDLGDQLLVQVVQRLERCVRATDTISREGGDEFVILLSDITDSQTASLVAQKLLEGTRAPFDLDGNNVITSVSIGISLFPQDGRELDTLRQKADTALYHAKDGGRNTYRFFAENMNADAMERLRLQVDLRQALKAEGYRLHYQPQFFLADSRMTGVEALLRWQHPERGLISPEAFLAVAEQSGLIIPIGEWVLHETCRQAEKWRQAGWADVVASVNVSAIEFRRGNILRSVASALDRSGLPARALQLELTESILLVDAESSATTLQALKRLGVRLSIDHFGAGYSSVSFIQRLSVDQLKMDPSLVRRLPGTHEDSALVKAIFQLGHTLGLEVVAEGVETVEQQECLRTEGCEIFQGCLLSPPVEADAIADLARSAVQP